MGKYSNQLKAREAAKENEKLSRETLGKYFYDLSKLSFGAMVLGVLVPWFITTENDRYLILFLLGVIATIIFAISAYRTIKI